MNRNSDSSTFCFKTSSIPLFLVLGVSYLKFLFPVMNIILRYCLIHCCLQNLRQSFCFIPKWILLVTLHLLDLLEFLAALSNRRLPISDSSLQHKIFYFHSWKISIFLMTKNPGLCARIYRQNALDYLFKTTIYCF